MAGSLPGKKKVDRTAKELQDTEDQLAETIGFLREIRKLMDQNKVDKVPLMTGTLTGASLKAWQEARDLFHEADKSIPVIAAKRFREALEARKKKSKN